MNSLYLTSLLNLFYMRLKNFRTFTALATGAMLLGLCGCASQPEPVKTRGIGVYPGDPSECAAPSLVPGGNQYRNLAQGRAASHSSSYDYSLTAQLVTDGMTETSSAPWFRLLVNGEPVPKSIREHLMDGRRETRISAQGNAPVIQFEFHGYPVQADKIEAFGYRDELDVISCEASDDGASWTAPGDKAYEYYRLSLKNNGNRPLDIRQVYFYKDGKAQDVLSSGRFHSAWKSEGCADEWIQVDLGSESSFDKMVFHWRNAPADAKVQVSSDGIAWKDIKGASLDECSFPRVKGRYVRALLASTADGEPFELDEWEIWGKGGMEVVPAEAPVREGMTQHLTRGAWKVCRASMAGECCGKDISSAGFDDSSWLPATVPGTVLTSWVNAAAVADPNYSDNQLFISDSYFRSDFWYRNVFSASKNSGTQFLHMDGVNSRADIYLNGCYVGMIDSPYKAASFNVTDILADGENVLAVKVYVNEHYGAVTQQNAVSSDANGGVLGADNPSMHATIGWDWIPTVRGRSVGIYDDVYLSYNEAVTIENPFVRPVLELPDTSKAYILAETMLANNTEKPVSGNLHFSYGDISVTVPQNLEPGERAFVKLDALQLDNPRLWWPVGYGNPELYPVSFSFEIDGKVSDKISFQSGVRQMDYCIEKFVNTESKPDERLEMYVNGKRFVGFGGNWGFSEHLLNYRGREYDAAVRYHADMNFNMIRNWVGQIPDKEFYEACDRYGVMVWQDFWLANPADGPDPVDEERFRTTAASYIRQVRNHPSIGIYVGRNEGFPPESLDKSLCDSVAMFHPGIYYLSNSADGIVSGRGTYRAMPPEAYYTLYGLDKFHSERGMPNVMNYENLVRALGEENVEPVNTVEHPNDAYGLHDYTLGNRPGVSSAQSADTFNKLIERYFGEPEDAREFSQWAQWVNYDGYRAIFEARSAHRHGMLLWMSHPAWPSLVWQCYDYYLEPTAAYFGCKKACEPLHIQWNPHTGDVEAVSWYSASAEGLTAEASLLGPDGECIWSQSKVIDLGEDQTVRCFPVEYPDNLPEVYFIKLALTDKDGNAVSENIYWKGRDEGSLRALLEAPDAELSLSQSVSESAEAYEISVDIANAGDVPAFMTRIKVVDSEGGDLVLPVMYSDNYFFLMPGEKKTVAISVKREDVSGYPKVEISALNLEPAIIR